MFIFLFNRFAIINILTYKTKLRCQKEGAHLVFLKLGL